MKKPAEAIHVTFTVFWRFYQKIIRLSTLEIEWYIDWLLFYNQQIKQSLTSTCRVSERMEVNSLIGEHICYMHSMHSYILLYMYVGRSQEVDEINMHHIQYMYLTLCYKAEPACKFRKKLIFFLNSLPQFFISKLTFLSTNITLSILSILAVYGMCVICTSY